MQIEDSDLLRSRCYIGGEWLEADNAARLDVTDPASGEVVARVPNLEAAETRRAIEAAERAWRPWRELTAAERGAMLRRWHDLMLENQEDLARIMTAEQGKPLAEARGEIAYAASFLDWFAEEGRRVYGDLIPPHQAGQAHPGAQAAHRRVRRHHPLELSRRHDHPQGGRGTGRRLPRGGQARGRDAAIRPGAGGAGGAGGHPRGRVQRDHGRGRRHRRGTDIEPDGAQAELYRLHRGRQAADAPVRGHAEKAVPGAWRQRPLHRLRRRGSGGRGGGGDAVKVPQYRPDLRLRQPRPGPGGHLRGLRRARGRAGRLAAGRSGHRRGQRAGSPDQPGGGREGRGPYRRCAGQGRPPRHRRVRAMAWAAPSSSPRCWRT